MNPSPHSSAFIFCDRVSQRGADNHGWLDWLASELQGSTNLRPLLVPRCSESWNLPADMLSVCAAFLFSIAPHLLQEGRGHKDPFLVLHFNSQAKPSTYIIHFLTLCCW